MNSNPRIDELEKRVERLKKQNKKLKDNTHKAEVITGLLQQLCDKNTLTGYEEKSIRHTIEIMKYSKVLNWC